jgi:probable HAF family extracellular repeat protein
MKNNTPFFLLSRSVSVVPKLATMLLIGASLLSAERVHAQITLTGLGGLSGGSSYPNAVSADGSVIVGVSNGQAFRWTSSGTVGLGFLSNDVPYGSAYGVSSDGSVVVGQGYDSSYNDLAVRWTSSGIESLGFLSGYASSSARGVSADGSVVVGDSYTSGYGQAFRWNSTTNMMVSLGTLGGSYSEARGVSGDGSVTVGNSDNQAFRWNATDGMVGLGVLPGTYSSSAYGVSGDGSVIVGDSGSSFFDREAFRWNATDGMVGLGFLTGGYSSSATGVSGDGSVVVGYSNDSNGYTQAFLWDETVGMTSLYDTLLSSGVDLTGWDYFNYATGISSDGTTIVGTGLYNGYTGAFVARNPSGWGSLSGSGVSAPEPGTLSLLGVSGIVGLVAKKRRAKK